MTSSLRSVTTPCNNTFVLRCTSAKWTSLPCGQPPFGLLPVKYKKPLFEFKRRKAKNERHASRTSHFLAPPVGLEPTTPWLTVRCSTDWAKEEYRSSIGKNRWGIKTNTANVEPRLAVSENVGIELSSRLVSKQVLSPQQSLTSVFGMGTGGPSAIKTPTVKSVIRGLLISAMSYFPDSSPSKYLRHSRA